MDPYLESHWGDVHTSLMIYARDQLQKQMPPGLRVRAEEQVTLHRAPGENGSTPKPRTFYPDLRVLEGQPGRPAAEPTAGGVAVAEPLVVPLELEEQTQRSIQILDAQSGNRVVTVIEFLSPANKNDPTGRTAYKRKQNDLHLARVNLVEVDLLREGPYVMMAPAQTVPETYRRPYRICVVRGCRPHEAEVYRVSLRERLPSIRVPLRDSDPDARLDLQDLIEKVYENGGYEKDLDYRVDPEPPLQGDDADWADARLRDQGRR
jgi:hypothetical protein